MKNPRRIPLILGLLSKYWAERPDLRLGQIISDLADDCDVDIFYLEDDKLEELLTLHNK